ncbi:hypothetical protein QBC46DRAFT_40663 [Diplogelasinospora grovesii]|uniref:Subtilisin-like serine protease n=1 Tax=Diplogelasinospora grovesii TaxID=303347 RepID=A0AAN6MZC0_9PEZI|nr:hypothetical protein QBC46DRAFT_40663 [Diplogelasinospora grovesii]
MEGQRSQLPPFAVQLLSADAQPDDEHFLSLFPASYRTELDDIAPPNLDDIACVEKELDLRRLNKISDWLWVAGRPMPPRPLHHQLLLSRAIFVTEQMDMHLVWTTGRIFLKPVPRFLLEPRFWTDCLSCRPDCLCSTDADEARPRGGARECTHRRLWKGALGFLFSYAALICHESDFLVARDKHLLPAEVAWPAWRTFVKQLDTEHIYQKIDGRFVYGELRLSRLNKIYLLSRRPFLRGYMSQWRQYGTFFQDNFAWLASAVVYVGIVLTAMQVGLATKSLADNDAFQSASYGFTVFSIVGPLAATGLILFIFCYMFVNNWVVTIAYKKRRFRNIETRLGL